MTAAEKIRQVVEGANNMLYAMSTTMTTDPDSQQVVLIEDARRIVVDALAAQLDAIVGYISELDKDVVRGVPPFFDLDSSLSHQTAYLIAKLKEARTSITNSTHE